MKKAVLKHNKKNIEFEVLMVINIKTVDFWDLTCCLYLLFIPE